MNSNTSIETKSDNSVSLQETVTGGECFGNRVKLLSIIQLAENIYSGCVKSLHELHERRFLPGTSKKKKRTITDLINCLAEAGKDMHKQRADKISNIEFAQSLTTDRFSRLSKPGMKQQGVNCRYYFEAFLNKMNKFKQKNPGKSKLVLEQESIKALEGLVKKHYFLSLKEAYRSNDQSFSRYTWAINGGSICTKMPVHITGRDRGEWLAKHITNPDPTNPNERSRIQAVIDHYFGKNTTTTFDDRLDYGQTRNQLDVFDESNKFDLGKTVAVEKVKLIDQQRPSIKKLGPHILKAMIEKIFILLEDGCFEDGNIAAEFGLSKSTFSRFAGSNWLKTENEIPDLWRNTAKVVMAFPEIRNSVNSQAIKKIVHNRT